MLHASHSFLRHVPFWIRLGNRFDCIYITIITQATADSVWHVATLCFGCHRNMWPKRVNQIKPAAHQLTILSLRRPCIGCHSCRHCAFFSASQSREMKGCTHPQPAITVTLSKCWVNQMLSWDPGTWLVSHTLETVGMVSIFDWSAFCFLLFLFSICRAYYTPIDQQYIMLHRILLI